MERPHLLYNSKYRVLVCRACQYALSPNGVKRHLERWHDHLSLDVRKALTRFAETLDLATISEVNALRPESDGVAGLRIQSGFQCMTCEYACATEGTITAH
jgi:hypothetical protein